MARLLRFILTSVVKDKNGKIIPALNNTNVVSYVDDILLTSLTQEGSLYLLDVLFARCQYFNVSLNAPKSMLLRDSVTYAGKVYSKAGTSPNPEKIDILNKMVHHVLTEDQVGQLMKFLGLSQFFRSHLWRFAHHVFYLYQLCSQNDLSGWTKSHEKSFRFVKQQL